MATTFEFFLANKQCLEVFYRFLKHADQQQQRLYQEEVQK